jgi:hypothetical protein
MENIKQDQYPQFKSLNLYCFSENAFKLIPKICPLCKKMKERSELFVIISNKFEDGNDCIKIDLNEETWNLDIICCDECKHKVFSKNKN